MSDEAKEAIWCVLAWLWKRNLDHPVRKSPPTYTTLMQEVRLLLVQDDFTEFIQ